MTTHRYQAFAIREKTPPAEIQLWSAGDNPTDYGVHRWTDRSVREVGGTYAARGNALLLDIEHNAAEPPDPANPPPTAGYARLELRAGEPWLVFDWSAIGAEQIRTGQRLYLSPEYEVDTKTSEIVRLVRVSLVSDPATHHARMLATAQRIRASGEPMDPKTVMAALEALEAGDATKALEVLKGLIAQAAGGGAAPPSAPAPEAAAAPAVPPPAGDMPPEEEKKAVAAKAPALPAKAPEAPAPDPVAVLASRVEGIERDALLARHSARLTEGQRMWASTQSLATVKGLIDASPEPSPAAPATKAGTRGATAGARASALPADEKKALDERMGVRRIAAGVQRTPNRVTFGVLTNEDAKKFLASRKAG